MIPGAKPRLRGAGLLFALLAGLLMIFALALPGAAARAPLLAVPSASPVQVVANADAFVAEGLPDRNFGSDGKLWVGYDAEGGYREEQILVAFPNSAPAGAVRRVQLRLWLAGAVTSGAELPVEAYRVLGPWDQSTVTWNTRPVIAGQAVATAGVGTELGWYQWDVTEAWKAWQQRSGTSFSLLLKAAGSLTQNERAYWSRECAAVDCSARRPVLEIDYEPTPTATFTPTLTPTATFTPTPTPTASSGLQWADLSLILLPRGSSVGVGLIHYNCLDFSGFEAVVTGAARFANGEHVLDITYFCYGTKRIGVALYPALGAAYGNEFTLFIQGLPVRRGVIARQSFDPVVYNSYAGLTPTPAPPTATATNWFIPVDTPVPADTPTETPTTTETPTATATHTPTNTPTETPTSTSTPTYDEIVKGTISVASTRVGIPGVVLEAHKSSGTNCGQLLALSPSPSTDSLGRYSIRISGTVPYYICVKPVKPNGCIEIAGRSYQAIVKYTAEGQTVAGIDFQYNCP